MIAKDKKKNKERMEERKTPPYSTERAKVIYKTRKKRNNGEKGSHKRYGN